jgi:small subunit ribosomal protein S19
MAKKEFKYHGKKIEELKELSLNQFAELAPSSIRRKITRGFTDPEKVLLKNLKTKDRIKTHCRDMVILPEMIDKTILIHNGKKYEEILIQDKMVGRRLGEFSLTRKRLIHSSPGVGQTTKRK